MLIDSHQHAFWHGRDDQGLVKDMDEHKINLAWLLTWEIAPWENPPQTHYAFNPLNIRTNGTHAGITLKDLIITRDRFPDRFLLGYCPHPLIGDAATLLEAARRMYGVRICGEFKYRMLINDPRCLNLFRMAGKLSMPVVIHLDVPYRMNQEGKWTYDANWYGGTIHNLKQALLACPETSFIGHAPGFWREISDSADEDTDLYPKGAITPGGRLQKLFEAHSTLYADLSANSALGALKRDIEHAKQFIEQFSERLLFGRDYYGMELFNLLEKLDLSQETKDRIYYLNAQKLIP